MIAALVQIAGYAVFAVCSLLFVAVVLASVFGVDCDVCGEVPE